jgi:hypothetical protein
MLAMGKVSPAVANLRSVRLKPARRADADQVAHDEPEIEAARMNQQALEDIRVAAQMRAKHPTRVVEMREGAFDPLASLTHQATAAGSTNPPPIGYTGVWAAGAFDQSRRPRESQLC